MCTVTVKFADVVGDDGLNCGQVLSRVILVTLQRTREHFQTCEHEQERSHQRPRRAIIFFTARRTVQYIRLSHS